MISNGLNLTWHAFGVPKAGNAAEEYEDAVAGAPALGRFAVADGASESSFAAAWARLLAEGFVAAEKPWRFLDWVPPLRQRWAEQVDNLVLPWFAEMKREEGAFATLLGVAFRPSRDRQPGTWRALAVGDCCLFRTRHDRLLMALPISASTDFSNRPQLLGSRPTAPQLPPRQFSGRWWPGDRFLLMSDALAQWFLERIEKKADPLGEIAGLLSGPAPRAAFPDWVEKRRRQGLRNDDVTLAVIDP